MSTILDIVRELPRWVLIVAFFIFATFMVSSIVFGRFMIAGYEFGFGPGNITHGSVSYTVVGSVKKEDGKPPFDITISAQYPPLYPTGKGDIVGLEVSKGPDGKFPQIGLSHDGYAPEGVDLNNKASVEERDHELHIREVIVLKAIP